MSHLTQFETFLLLSVIKIAVVLVITLTAVAYTVLLERKVIGRMQNRWGPSRTGPAGLLQPLADGIKLFLKEDLTPLAVQGPLFLIAPMIALGCALVSIAVVTFGALTKYDGVDLFEIANVNIGLLVILGVTSIGVYGIALSGWSSNNKFALLGSLRATSQMISYELALGLSLVGVVLRAGSLNLRTIVDSQSANRSPFDLPEAESELVAGYHTEYSSMKFAMFFMAEYANMITISCVATLLFFGGAGSPFGHLFPSFGWLLDSILPIFWFVLKVFLFLFLFIWVRSTLPRFRYDQLMGFGWKFLLPVAMLNILATSLVLAFHG